MNDLQPAYQERLSHLVVRRRALSEAARLAWAIRAVRAWLGPAVEPAPAGMHRHQADLRLRVSDHPSLVTFGKAAFVDIGPVHALEDGGWEVEVGWRASSLAPLFPVFSGTIVARSEKTDADRLVCPARGYAGSRRGTALLHIAAEGTARWLLLELDEAAAQGAA